MEVSGHVAKGGTHLRLLAVLTGGGFRGAGDLLFDRIVHLLRKGGLYGSRLPGLIQFRGSGVVTFEGAINLPRPAAALGLLLGLVRLVAVVARHTDLRVVLPGVT